MNPPAPGLVQMSTWIEARIQRGWDAARLLAEWTAERGTPDPGQWALAGAIAAAGAQAAHSPLLARDTLRLQALLGGAEPPQQFTSVQFVSRFRRAGEEWTDTYWITVPWTATVAELYGAASETCDEIAGEYGADCLSTTIISGFGLDVGPGGP